MWSISTYNQGTFEIHDKIHLSPSIMSSFILHETICKNTETFLMTWTLKKVGKDESCAKEEFVSNHLTGFFFFYLKDDWDQIFSVWQSGQYRAPVIKPLPVKHPARIDEFPLGRAELSFGLQAQEGGILSMEPVLACSSLSARGELKSKDQETRSLLSLKRQTCRLSVSQ